MMRKPAFAALLLLALAIRGGAARAAEPDAAPSAAPGNKYRRSRFTRDESQATADKRSLLLATGEDRAVDIDFEVASHDAVGVGNPTVVVPQLVKVGDKRQLVFKPLKAGQTSVTVRDVDGNLKLVFAVRVTGSSLLRAAGEIRDLLRDVEGINIRIVGNKVVVEGEVLVPADYAKLLAVAGEGGPYKDIVLNMTVLSPLAMQVLAKRIQEDINVFAPNARTRVVNGVIFLEGSVNSLDEATRAAKVATIYIPELRPGNPLEKLDTTAQRLSQPRSLIQNFLVVNPPPPKKQEKLVRLTVHFVELSKDYNKLFGFKWQPGFTSDPAITIGTGADGAAAASAGPSFSATISSLIPKLQSAQTAGYARVLKTGTVIVRSGQPAKLSETTEFPFVVTQANGTASSQSKPVGLTVAVTPLILGQSEDIQLDMQMEQSNVVGRVPAGTAPVTSNHRVETKIYVRSTESAAVAGVTSSQVGTNFNKDDPLPGAFEGNTQPMFSLLHSKAYDKKRSQFVIFVTPQIVENASEGTLDLQRNFRVKVR